MSRSSAGSSGWFRLTKADTCETSPRPASPLPFLPLGRKNISNLMNLGFSRGQVNLHMVCIQKDWVRDKEGCECNWISEPWVVCWAPSCGYSCNEGNAAEVVAVSPETPAMLPLRMSLHAQAVHRHSRPLDRAPTSPHLFENNTPSVAHSG